MTVTAKNVTLEQYNSIMFRRLVTALHSEYGVIMQTGKRGFNHIIKRQDLYTATAHNNTRTLAYRLVGLKPKVVASIRKNVDNLTRYMQTGERRPVRFEEPGSNTLIVEVPKMARHWEEITVDYLESRGMIRPGSLRMTFGIGHQNRPMAIDFNSVHSSTLGVFGITQSGKTNTIRLLIWEAMISGKADIILADVGLKEKNFGVFEGAAALAHPLIVDPKEAYNLLVWLKAEIHRRASNHQEDHKPLIVVIDEVQTFVDYTAAHGGDTQKMLADVIRQCIQVGIKIIVSTQLAQVELVGKGIRNLQGRICHKVDTATSGTAALGVKGAGAEGLLGFGDCLYKNTMGVHRMAVARLDEEKDAGQFNRIEQGPQRTIADLGRTRSLESISQDIPVQRPSQAPDEMDYGQLASVIFEPAGKNKLKKRFGIGDKKVKRLQKAATEVRTYALHRGHKALPEPDSEIIEAAKGVGYNWLDSDWEEV